MTSDRTKIIREICTREGHGQLIETTTLGELPHRHYICQRGCGIDVVEITGSVTVAQATVKWGRPGTELRVGGRIELVPVEDIDHA